MNVPSVMPMGIEGSASREHEDDEKLIREAFAETARQNRSIYSVHDKFTDIPTPKITWYRDNAAPNPVTLLNDGEAVMMSWKEDYELYQDLSAKARIRRMN